MLQVFTGPIPFWFVFFLLLFFFLFPEAHLCHFMSLPIYHSKEKNTMWKPGKTCHAHAPRYTQRCCFCFIFLITPASGNLLPLHLKWILSRPFRFSASDALMKGDSTIWTDQVAASSAQLRARNGDTPLLETKDKSTVRWYTHYPSH